VRPILLIFGTRPEAVKMAPVARALQAAGDLEPVVCLTGQHREMVEQILPAFEIRPDFNLDIMAENQSPADVASAVFRELPAVIHRVEPAVVLVQGDTTTAMASAVVGHYARVPVGHVEAGLRTGQLFHPFPEEANRKVISAVTTLHFAPTARAVQNLAAENVTEGVFQTGNTVVDALQHLLRTLEPASQGDRRRILVTAHRRESFGAPIRRIFGAIRAIAERHEDVEVLYPVHPNPEVSGPAVAILGSVPRVHLVPPMDYIEFIPALAASYLALTDSGGLQEEAPVLGKPVLVMREHTERPEAIEAGCAELVGTDEERIVSRASALLDDPETYARMSRPASPFGDGHAAERIVEALRSWFQERK